MATEPTPQRVYRAACPNCGAPVEFRSASSAYAVCGFCKSTVVRDGDALRRIGQSAELFDDHSPLRLGASGRYQGAAFTLVGRLQLGYAEGTWNEWHALFETGPDHQKSGWLSEDNGRYVIGFDAPLGGAAPSAESLRPGAPLVVAGQAWSVASVTRSRVIAAQGELPGPPWPPGEFVVVDLRNPGGEVGTLDYGDPARPRWSVGHSAAISELAMSGLADAAEKTLAGRSFECPNCGAALAVKLATTQSIVCSQCHAVVDVSQGVGGELAHYVQQTGGEPQIPLGTIGELALFERGGQRPVLPWQVVGYAERCEVASGEGDEQSVWREYLLYHRIEGFAFIVDAQDGWSCTATITGVPERFGESVKWDGLLYRKLYDYTGRVIYVLGEFYWRLQRDQLTANSDYQGSGAAGAKRLNRERTVGVGGDEEIVWSAGETLSADTVLHAFRLAPEQRASLQRDAMPLALNVSSPIAKIALWFVIGVVILAVVRFVNRSDCDELRDSYGQASQEYRSCLADHGNGVGAIIGGLRTGGGSYGGYSSGGSHK